MVPKLPDIGVMCDFISIGTHIKHIGHPLQLTGVTSGPLRLRRAGHQEPGLVVEPECGWLAGKDRET